MRSSVTRLLCAALLIPPAICQAAGTPLLPALSSKVMVLALDGSPLGATGSTPPAPAWNFAQWSNLEEMSPASLETLATGWRIPAPHSRVQYWSSVGGASNVYEFAHSGVKCSERDLFVSVADSSVTTSAALSALGSVRVKVGLSVPYVDDSDLFGFLTACPMSGAKYAQYTMALILNSSSGQTLFYQIELGKTFDAGASMGWCPDYETSALPNQFCLDDDVRNFSPDAGSYVTPSSPYPSSGGSSFSLDFLPRIRRILSVGHTKSGDGTQTLDSNPAHWTIGSVYMGQILQGNTVSTSRFFNPEVNTYPGGTFCGGTTATQYSCGAGVPEGSGWVSVGFGCYHRNTGLPCF